MGICSKNQNARWTQETGFPLGSHTISGFHCHVPSPVICWLIIMRRPCSRPAQASFSFVTDLPEDKKYKFDIVNESQVDGNDTHQLTPMATSRHPTSPPPLLPPLLARYSGRHPREDLGEALQRPHQGRRGLRQRRCQVRHRAAADDVRSRRRLRCAGQLREESRAVRVGTDGSACILTLLRNSCQV